MSIKRIFIVISAIFAVSAVFADNSSVTSKKYVDDLMSGYQGKLPGSGANTLMIYDNSEDGIGEKSIETTLGENAIGVPTVGAVKTGLDGKQDTITGTAGYVMTGTGTPGDVDERAIYSANTNYTDSLVTAETVNSGVINAVNSSLIRVDENGAPSDSGILWEINTDLLALDVRGYLPDGYTRLEYIESTGRQYIDTGITGAATWKITAQSDVVTENTILVARNTSGAAFFGALSNGYWGAGTSTNYFSNVTNTTKANMTVNFTQDTVSGTVNGNSFTRPGTASGFANAYKLCAFNDRYFFRGKIWKARCVQNGSVVMNLVPAKYDNNGTITVGMYDIADPNPATAFHPSNTSTAFVAGPTCVSPNLFNKNTADANRVYAFFQSSGTQWFWAELGFSVRIPCKPNTKYTARYNGNETQAVLGFGSTSNDEVPTQGTVPVTQAIRQNNPTINTPITITTGPNDKWLIVAYNVAEPQHSDMADNLQIEEGPTATTYRPYGENICD